jgi:DNA-binding NtrC family response regulator
MHGARPGGVARIAHVLAQRHHEPPTMNTNPRVLIVDDEEVVRRCHLRVLASDHCEVKAVPDGTQALETMQAEPFDIVLLDLRMPGMDGMAVLRQIRSRWPDCEVIVITGYPSLDTAKEAIRLGARDYLAKPLEPATVIRAAASAIEHKQWTLHRDFPPPRAFAGHGVQQAIYAN